MVVEDLRHLGRLLDRARHDEFLEQAAEHLESLGNVDVARLDMEVRLIRPVGRPKFAIKSRWRQIDDAGVRHQRRFPPSVRNGRASNPFIAASTVSPLLTTASTDSTIGISTPS